MYWSRVLETLCGLVQFGVAIVQEKGRRELIRIVNPSVITTMSLNSRRHAHTQRPLQFFDNEALTMFLQSHSSYYENCVCVCVCVCACV